MYCLSQFDVIINSGYNLRKLKNSKLTHIKKVK